MLDSRLGFFKRRVTMAFLRASRPVPESRKLLTMRILRRARLLMQTFRSPMEIG